MLVVNIIVFLDTSVSNNWSVPIKKNQQGNEETY